MTWEAAKAVGEMCIAELRRHGLVLDPPLEVSYTSVRDDSTQSRRTRGQMTTLRAESDQYRPFTNPAI
jgi:hypothetical protein